MEGELLSFLGFTSLDGGQRTGRSKENVIGEMC